jgi:hypothetical protein
MQDLHLRLNSVKFKQFTNVNEALNFVLKIEQNSLFIKFVKNEIEILKKNR